MTIRSFLPGFGMRTVAALAVAAAVVIAALLAVGSPASAQSSDWRGDMVRDDHGGGQCHLQGLLRTRLPHY